MAETVNQEATQAAQAANPAADGAPAANTAAAPASAAPRTFTQEELDRIVAERLQRATAKFADYDSTKKELADLKKANEIRDIRQQVAEAKKIPLALLTGDTKEACEAQADAILAFARTSPSAPTVPDGGEARTSSGGSARDLFAAAVNTALGN